MTEPPWVINYASMTDPPVKPADARRMFFYLLPTAAFAAAFVGSYMIEAYYDGDSRNIGGPMCMLAMAPTGLIGLAVAAREAFRPGGVRAVASALVTNAALVAGMWLAMWLVIHYRWLR